MQTLQNLPGHIDWMIVDNYSLGQTWETLVRPACGRVLAIDDLARRHDCDLLIDPNWHAEHTHTRYTDLVPMHARTLHGPDFAFVDTEFLHYRISPVNRLCPPKRVFVYFGGSDLFGLSALVLTVLSSAEFSHLDVDVVIGATAATSDVIRQFATGSRRITVHYPQPTLAPLLAQADIAIGAVGGTTWERMCLGVPTMAAIVADNQFEAAQQLSKAGLLYLLGPAAEVAEKTLACGLRTLLGDPALRQRMADGGQALVDGRGIDRIVDAMAALS